MSAPPDDPYRELFERSADAILILEGDTFVDCNQAAVEMLRYPSRAEVLRIHPWDISPPTQPDGRVSLEKANEMIATAIREGSHRFEWDHKRADGEVFPVEVLLTAVPRGDDLTLHAVLRDITDRRRLETELRHAQKMEAIGNLTAGIAHNFNNLLVGILGNASLLELDLGDRPRQQGYAREVTQAGRRAADLVRHLLSFGRKDAVAPRAVDLGRLVRDLEGFLRMLLGEPRALALDLPPGSVLVEADPGQIEQVLANLVTNARDAMPYGGTVTIALTKLGATGTVRLAVRDTGVGMEPEVVRQAFDPFFTTKEQGKGTGLGLSTVYGILSRAGGEVELRSTPGEGTTVEVHFPAAPEPQKS